MELSDLRNQLVELSGRSDLEMNSVVDNSIFKKRGDFFIQVACKWLDENIEVDRSFARYSSDLTTGQFRLLVPEAMSIKDVYAQNGVDSIVTLEKKFYEWIRSEYGKSLSSLSYSKPAYYVRSIPDLSPQQIALKTTDYTDDYTYEFGDTLFADESTPGDVGRYRSSALLIVPPVSTTYTITVVGKFFSKILVDDTDVNYWTENRFELLLKTSLRAIEGFYRNSEGLKDWDRFMETDLIGIEKSVVDEEVGNINEMEG